MSITTGIPITGNRGTGETGPGPAAIKVRETISPQEKKRILDEFNATDEPYPKEKTIDRLFQHQVEKCPGDTAVIFRDIQLTYRELNRIANQLATFMQLKGLRHNGTVGIMVNRSLEMAVGILAVWKAGGAYLPIDPGTPAERIRYLLEDSNAPLVLTREIDKRETPAGCEIVDLEDSALYSRDEQNPAETGEYSPGNLAYVIYTSGSTGRPKGVMIEHYSLVNRLNWMQKKYFLDKKDILLQKTPFTFDVSVWELSWWMMGGARLCFLIPGGEKDPGVLVEAIEKYHITVVHFVPSMLKIFLEYTKAMKAAGRVNSLRQVIASGETLTPSHVHAFYDLLYATNATRLDNLYGPTEATIDVSYFSCTPRETYEIVPIGKPIDNICLYILDNHMDLQPIGMSGELYIAGDGVARGYLNRPELTAEKFIRTVIPHSSFVIGGSLKTNDRLYKTGDQARWLPDGNIEFLGRMDHQVKIRGYRIETGEIEAVLNRHPQISESIVAAREDIPGSERLVAYIVAKNRTKPPLGEVELRHFLQAKLPDYMIPVLFVPLDSFPLSANGKIDRRDLPAPRTGDITVVKKKKTTATPHVPTSVEQELTAIISDVLNLHLERVSIHDNFFQLGGDSLLSFQVVLQAKQVGIEITSTDVFKHPTIAALAAAARKVPIVQEPIPGAHDGDTRDIYPLTPIQQQMFAYNLLTPDPINTIQHLSWLMMGELDIGAFKKAWQTVARRHCILRTAFKKARLKEPVQQVHDPITIPWQQVDCSQMTDEKQQQVVEDYILKDKQKRFKMSEPPLIRLYLFILNNRSYRFICSYSSILFDNWSSTIIVKEVFHFYDSYRKGDRYQVSLPGPRLFAGYVKWLYSHDRSEVKYFWAHELENFHSPVDLKVRRLPGHADSTVFKPAERAIRLPSRQVHDLKALANKYRLTPGTLLQGAWVITLSYFSEEEDILSGVLSYGRPAGFAGIGSMVGLFINTVPVRVKVPGHRHFITWLKEFQDKQFLIRQFDYVTSDDISKWSQVPQNKIQKAIYERTFVLVKVPGEEFFSGLSRDNPIKISRYDDSLLLNVPLRIYAELSDSITLRLKYDRSCFAPAAIDEVADYLEKLLRNIIINSGVSLGDLKNSKMMTRGNSGLKEV